MRTLLLLSALLVLASCSSPSTSGPSDTSAPSATSATSATSVPSPSSSRAPAQNHTDLPLALPDGFRIETLASGLSGARAIVRDTFGNFWVSRPDAGIVTHLEMSGSTLVRTDDVLRGLRKPHGLAIDPTTGFTLYIAEETAIKRVPLYSDGPIETIATLPAGGRHTTRSLGIGPDDRLYVSIGSTCDVCVEGNELHGTIISMNKDGSDRRIVAQGLRNAVFFTWHPVRSSLWATEMGRDMLGDDLPPEEINEIPTAAEGEPPHFGWPFCYGDRVRDESFQPRTSFDCAATVPPAYTLPAHVAPLGLSFIPAQGWPAAYDHDLLVAEHGSWNSTVPVGYRIVRIPLDANGRREGETMDFITGFHDGRTALGRPVDLLALPDGTLYITDDKRGAVYRLTALGASR